jgi:hypothetical protein
MPKKDSRFDRVVTGAKNAGKFMMSENKYLKKVDRASESYMQKKANKAMSEGKEGKAKAYAAAEGVRKAVMPTTNAEIAAIGAGALAKGASATSKFVKGSKMATKKAFGEKMAKGRVASANKAQEKAKDAGFVTVKTSGNSVAKKTERVLRDPEKAADYSIRHTKKEMDKVALRKGQKIQKKSLNEGEYQRESVKKLRDKDIDNSDYAKHGVKEAMTEEKGFTSRGKPIGKPIQDQGGSKKRKLELKKKEADTMRVKGIYRFNQLGGYWKD